MRIEFDRVERTHHILFHFRLKDGKILIQPDSVEYGIAHDLLDVGIAQEDILLNMFALPHPWPEKLVA